MGLSTLFMTEMWERFSFYGMRALLTLFLVADIANGGFGMDRASAFTIYGIFTGLVYVTPMIGGILADKVLGQRVTIFIGGIIMAIAQFMLSTTSGSLGMVDREFWFYCGLGLLIIGNGFFKPNISTLVGDLYDNNDPKKDGGFSIFLMGINIGAFSPFLIGILSKSYGWSFGFMSAGIGMVLGVLWFAFKASSLGNIGLPPKADKNRVSLVGKDWLTIVTYVVLVTASIIGGLKGWNMLSESAQSIIAKTVGIGGGLYLITTIVMGTKGKEQWSQVGVILILALFGSFFWIGFEQAGTTLNLFAEDSTQRFIGSFEMPAEWFQSINPVFIILFAPIFSMLWVWLDRKNLNPKTPYKFGWGLLLLVVGCVVMYFANQRALTGAVSPLWLVAVYMFFTLGELCLSPIGLSMITKLSPPKLVSTLMGVWMLSYAAGNFGASQMERLSEFVSESYDVNIPVFLFIGGITLIVALIAFAMGPWLSKMMKGVH